MVASDDMVMVRGNINIKPRGDAKKTKREQPNKVELLYPAMQPILPNKPLKVARTLFATS
jgi:hypothetical protein